MLTWCADSVDWHHTTAEGQSENSNRENDEMTTRKQTAAALKAVDKALQQAAQVQILLSRAALAARLAGLHDTAAEMDNIDTALGAGIRQYTDMLMSRVAKAAG